MDKYEGCIDGEWISMHSSCCNIFQKLFLAQWWLDGLHFRKCKSLFEKAKLEHFVSLVTARLPKSRMWDCVNHSKAILMNKTFKEVLKNQHFQSHWSAMPGDWRCRRRRPGWSRPRGGCTTGPGARAGWGSRGSSAGDWRWCWRTRSASSVWNK